MKQNLSAQQLNEMSAIPLEQWGMHGVRVRAASANSDGKVNSAILANGKYVIRRYWNNFQNSSLFAENESVLSRYMTDPTLVPNFVP